MTAALYDYLASRHAELGAPSQPVDRLLDDAAKFEFHDVYDLDKRGLANAMKARGLIYRDGMISTPEPEPGELATPADTTAEFIAAVMLIFSTAQYPVDTPDLIRRSGITPPVRMVKALKTAGLHYIKGLGYWTDPQYTTPDGKLVSARIPSERLAALSAIFEQEGWPLTGQDAERLTGGLVTRRWLAKQATKDDAQFVAVSDALGLYAPKDQAVHNPFPITPVVAALMLEHSDGRLLNNRENLRAYKISLLLERNGFARVKRSRSQIENQRTNTARVKLSKDGESWLNSHVSSADKF